MGVLRGKFNNKKKVKNADENIKEEENKEDI